MKAAAIIVAAGMGRLGSALVVSLLALLILEVLARLDRPVSNDVPSA